jgi:hypothetical protein
MTDKLTPRIAIKPGISLEPSSPELLSRTIFAVLLNREKYPAHATTR